METLNTPSKSHLRPAGMPLPMAMTAFGVHETAFALLRRAQPAPAKVIDLACGQGAFTSRLLAAGYDPVSVDLDTSGFRVPSVQPITCDLSGSFAETLGVGVYDACAAIEIIEHVENPFRFLRQCRRLLREGGSLVLTSPNVESIASRLVFLWNGRLRFFTPDETHHISPIFGWLLSRGLAEAGFNTVEVTYNRHVWDCGESLKARIGGFLGRTLAPFVTGDKLGEIRVVLARAC